MRTLKLNCFVLLSILLFLSFSSISFSQVTYIDVYPSGGSEDALNVQLALDAVNAGGTVHLNAGTFNFNREWVEITKPCILEGESAGGLLLTSILNGGSAAALMEAIAINSGGVTVKDLNFDGLELFGVFVYPLATGNVVRIQNNHFGNLPHTEWSYPIGCFYVSCSVEILDNTMGECFVGIYLRNVSGTQLRVEGNVIKSYGTSARNGIFSFGNSANLTIVNNDFSELTTWEAQVAIFGGQNHLVKNNVFGPSNGEGSNLPYLPTAVTLMSYGIYPTFNCTLMNNDYRGCQLPGWGYDESENLMGGCVLILNYGNGVYDNLVNETGRFPQGTGGSKKQVVEIPDVNVYNNRIIGHRANEIAYLEDEYPGIGQRIKESCEDMMLISDFF